MLRRELRPLRVLLNATIVKRRLPRPTVAASANGGSPIAASRRSQRAGPEPARRQVLIWTAARTSVIGDSYGPVAQQARAELERRSDAELVVILTFVETGTRLQHLHADRIRQHPGHPGGRPTTP